MLWMYCQLKLWWGVNIYKRKKTTKSLKLPILLLINLKKNELDLWKRIFLCFTGWELMRCWKGEKTSLCRELLKVHWQLFQDCSRRKMEVWESRYNRIILKQVPRKQCKWTTYLRLYKLSLVKIPQGYIK